MNTSTMNYLNLADLEALSGGDDEFLNEMIDMYRTVAAPDFEELSKCAETEDYQRVRQLAHKLKSTVKVFGIDLLHQKLYYLESQLNNNILPDDFKNQILAVMQIHQAVLLELQTYQSIKKR